MKCLPKQMLDQLNTLQKSFIWSNRKPKIKHSTLIADYGEGGYKDIDINRKNDLILIMTPEKQDKALELSKHWSADSTLARNEVIMKRTYPVKSVKCNKICSNY